MNADHRKTVLFVSLYLLWIATWLTCAVIGLVGWRRLRRARRALASTSTA
jgi:hypothetical protein